MDAKGFGYGGSGMRSNLGKYSRFGQSFGAKDVVTAVLDCDRRAIYFFKNGVRVPGDAFKIDTGKMGVQNPVFHAHVLCKEASFRVIFDGSLPDVAGDKRV